MILPCIYSWAQDSYQPDSIHELGGEGGRECVIYMAVAYQGLLWFVCRLTLRSGGMSRWGMGTEMEGHGLRLPGGYASVVAIVWTSL